MAIQGLDSLKIRDGRWYLPEFADARAKKVHAMAKHLWSENRARRENYARYWGLYSNLPMPGLTPRRYNQRGAGVAPRKLALNGCAAATNQYVAKITSQRPKVEFSTSGGDWDLQQRAHLLEKFNDGIIYQNDVYERVGPIVEKDVGIFGTGIVKTYADGDSDHARIVHERVMPFWVFCDDEEAQNGDPRCLYERRYVDRVRAMALWPEHAEEIARASRDPDDFGESHEADSRTDTVCVTEAFHLPSGVGPWGFGGTDTGDGMHCIIIGEVLVLEEDCARYPYEFVYMEPPVAGIWGTGIIEQIQGVQFELNTIVNMIRVTFRIGGSIRWVTPDGSTLNFSDIAHDIIGGRIKYTGPTAPTPIVPPTVGPEVFQHMDRLWGKMFEIPGISMMSATSSVPAQEESGKAKQLRLDTETERFQVAVHQYHNLFVRLSRNQVIPLARELSEKNKDFRVKAITRRTMETVRAADALLSEDDMAMKAYPVSSFADDPVARTEQVQEMLNSGSPLITPQEGRRLIRDPDLEEWQSVDDASYDLAQDMISDILKYGRYEPPDPAMNLDEAARWGQLRRLKAKRQGAPEDRLQMLSDWVQQCKDLQPKPPQPPAGPPGAGPPPGPPGPPMQGAPGNAPPGAGAALPMAA